MSGALLGQSLQPVFVVKYIWMLNAEVRQARRVDLCDVLREMINERGFDFLWGDVVMCVVRRTLQLMSAGCVVML